MLVKSTPDLSFSKPLSTIDLFKRFFFLNKVEYRAQKKSVIFSPILHDYTNPSATHPLSYKFTSTEKNETQIIVN